MRTKLNSLAESSDEQLWRLYRQGDRAALELLVRRHEDRLARIAYRITGSIHDAEDARHSVFVRLLQSPDDPVELANVAAWLTRCTVNEALSRVRKRARETRLKSVWARRSNSGNSAGDSLPHRGEVDDELRAALLQLSDDDRVLLALRFDDDLTFREIGEAVARPPSTVKSQVAKAIARLRALLGPRE